ncbi:glycosyltransferase, partial [bacterium]|nr:glycosyltransferase [bacterium]
MSAPERKNAATAVRIAVVIPCYKVSRQIAGVIANIPFLVWRIYVIDDACPEGSGKFVEANLSDERLRVVYHRQNQGVGGAVIT